MSASGDLMKYPRDYATRLADNWKRIYPSSSDPMTPDDMGRILDCAFYASMLKEEGRTIRTSLQITEECRKNSRLDWALSLFEKPVPLSPNALRKLSPAIDADRDDFIIEKTTIGLAIVGIEHGALSERPYMEGIFGSARFRVRATSPGRLVVESAGDRILVLGAGEGFEFRESLEPTVTGPLEFALRIQASSTLWTILSSILTSHLNESEAKRGVSAIIRIAHLMQEKGHGGLLLVGENSVPAGVDPQSGFAIESNYQGVLLKAIRKHYSAMPQGFPEPSSGGGIPIPALDAISEFRLAADHIASLTQVDGAVCLGPDLSLLKFGAVVLGAQNSDESPPVSCFDPYAQAHYPLQHVGTRHRAAIRFCEAAQHTGVAIVASQDGILTLIAKLAGNLYGIRPFIG